MRPAPVFSCLLASLLAAAGAGAKDKPEAAKAEQFIDRSNIYVAEKAGEFVVDSHEQDPGVFGGVMIGYAEPRDLPRSFTVTAYVYPIGRMDGDTGVTAGIGHVVEGIKGNEHYSKVQVEPDAEFSVAAPAMAALRPPGSKHETVIGPSSESLPGTPASEADMTAAMQEMMPPATTVGRRVVVHMDRDGVPVRSIGYVFYRQLMLVKLRMTVDASEMDEATFLKTADDAARTLAPSLLVENFGECGVARIPLSDKDKEDDSGGKSGAVALMREMGRLAREGCAVTEGKPLDVPPGMHRHTLVYPPGTWR